MNWNLRIAKRARNALEKVPAKDRARILAALDEMSENPFVGDIVQ
jgi:mRNA-degrading endonuclease RelE of RelBE toxin-antitoxin system